MTRGVQHVWKRVPEEDQVECAQPEEDLKLRRRLDHRGLHSTLNAFSDGFGDCIGEIHDRFRRESDGLNNLNEHGL